MGGGPGGYGTDKYAHYGYGYYGYTGNYYGYNGGYYGPSYGDMHEQAMMIADEIMKQYDTNGNWEIGFEEFDAILAE